MAPTAVSGEADFLFCCCLSTNLSSPVKAEFDLERDCLCFSRANCEPSTGEMNGLGAKFGLYPVSTGPLMSCDLPVGKD